MQIWGRALHPHAVPPLLGHFNLIRRWSSCKAFHIHYPCKRNQIYRQQARFHVCQSLKSRTSSTAEDFRLQYLKSSPNLLLHNSLTRQKEIFKPKANDGTVLMYVCGVTVYDYSHIGHARVYISFDLLYRFLRYLGYKVKYTRNFTDIDDKIIKRANEAGTSAEALTQKFIEEFHVDMEALNCLPPTDEPKATAHIQAIVQDIKKILANGHGYASGGDVFFDVTSLKSYGNLSGRTQENNRAGERVAIDSRKRNAADFVLWKASKEGEPQWESPWGLGRPGWHIECSAMIRETMGPAIDIHGGGRDLIFPHHENEIAQAEAASSECECQELHTDRGFVNYWLHNGFVNVDSEKMSKSLGNFFTIRDVTKQYHPLALRFFLVNSQYRSPVNYTQAALESAAERMYYIYQALFDCKQGLEGNPVPDKDIGTSAEEMIDRMQAGLADDLNPQPAVSSLWEAAKKVNELCYTKKGKKAPDRHQQLHSCWVGFNAVLDVLGLWSDNPQAALAEMRHMALHRSGMTEQEVLDAIDRRAVARSSKDFSTADAIRITVAEKGIQIMDTPQGTNWRPCLKSQGVDSN